MGTASVLGSFCLATRGGMLAPLPVVLAIKLTHTIDDLWDGRIGRRSGILQFRREWFCLALSIACSPSWATVLALLPAIGLLLLASTIG